MNNQIDIQTHAYINIVTGDKSKTMEKLVPVLNELPIDEIDDDSFEYEVRLYFDGIPGVSRIAYAAGRIEQLLNV
ncbi:hypothetical protein [Crateriforma conspicua]|uniref:Uncharacterized protein n=1 Tax=Crateriforma conspicua TaxID=2527996 RepID=A0A5C6FFS5_9PLAN|nr:hypothetical protein [Crateriforma conspicua]TWU59617.1 hypothetical protein V7x_55270 [Crateriforma conspicua]